jgi:pimeloyl-ACP methyl ester carboxylesterase
MAAVADYVITANPNLRTQAKASPAARQRLRQMFLDLNPRGYAHTIRAMLMETFPAEQLATLTMPTLVLVGDADSALDATKWTHQQIPGSHLVIPATGRAFVESGCTGGLQHERPRVLASDRVIGFQDVETSTICCP